MLVESVIYCPTANDPNKSELATDNVVLCGVTTAVVDPEAETCITASPFFSFEIVNLVASTML